MVVVVVVIITIVLDVVVFIKRMAVLITVKVVLSV